MLSERRSVIRQKRDKARGEKATEDVPTLFSLQMQLK